MQEEITYSSHKNWFTWMRGIPARAGGTNTGGGANYENVGFRIWHLLHLFEYKSVSFVALFFKMEIGWEVRSLPPQKAMA